MWADELVLFFPRSLPELEQAVRELERSFRRHRTEWDPFLGRPAPEGVAFGAGPLRILWEHELLAQSITELLGHVRRLRTSDYDAQRHALGQFWRIVAETFSSHLDGERGYRDAAVRLLEGR
jgi:hypothetical protein